MATIKSSVSPIRLSGNTRGSPLVERKWARLFPPELSKELPDPGVFGESIESGGGAELFRLSVLLPGTSPSGFVRLPCRCISGFMISETGINQTSG